MTGLFLRTNLVLALCFTQQVLADGKSEALDCIIQPHMVIKVGSPAQGIVDTITVERGDIVKQGQMIAQLNSDMEKATYNLGQAKLKFLEGKYERVKELKEKGLASDESIEEAETEMYTAQMDLERSRILYDHRSVTSPVKGVVMERTLSPGEYVYEQTPVMTIAQIDPLNVEVYVPMSKYRLIKKGMKAKIYPEKPLEEVYTGTVEIVDKVIDAASNTFGVRLKLRNKNLTIPAGIKCTAEFIIKK